VRVDRAGNIYVADNIKPPDRPYPADLASQLPPIAPGKLWDWPYGHQNWYLFNCGALMKFGPAGGTISTSASADDPGAQFAGSRSGKMRYVTVSGAIWRHVGISPVPADTGRGHGGGCVCANARFDIDAFGRVYVPDVLRFAVDVLDSGGNAITSFGRYGNADCRGPDVALAWGAFVGCSNKAVYVCDAVNRRIVRAVPAFAAEATCAIVGPGR